MKKYSITCLMLPIILVISIGCFLLLPHVLSFYERFNLSLLLGTGLAVIWYTIETHIIRADTKEQIEISVMPSLAVQKNEEDSFSIMNVGNGVAINIKFEDTVISEELGFTFKFPSILSLMPKETFEVKVERLSGKEFYMAAHFDTKVAIKQFKITVTFEDICRRKYRQYFELGKEGPYIGAIERVCLHTKDTV